jgi:hypothetical protein
LWNVMEILSLIKIFEKSLLNFRASHIFSINHQLSLILMNKIDFNLN